MFKLRYPNIEVKNALRPLIFNNFFSNLETATATKTKIQDAVDNGNYEGIINIFNNMLSGIHERHRRTTEDQDSGKKEDFYNGQIARFLVGAEFDTESEVSSNKGIVYIVAKRNGKALVIEGKYVDIGPPKTISLYKIESNCRAKLKDAVSQIYNQNYADKYGIPMRLAIVYDESRAARISHAAYNETAYRLDGKKLDFNVIGKVKYDGLIWKLSYTSEISASKEERPLADILKKSKRWKVQGKKRTSSRKAESSERDSLAPLSPKSLEDDTDTAAAELILFQSIMPFEQNSSWREALKGTNCDKILDHIRRLKLILAKTQSASFWHSLSQEEKLTAFQHAVHAEVPVTLRYITPDGTFYLTAIDVYKREAIGLLVLPTHQSAYGPYPLSRLLAEGSELLPPGTETRLKYICAEQFIDKDASLPTPEQLLKWNEKR
jgi:hypothetical protein